MMMTHSVLHENLKTSLWTKCIETATKLRNIMVNPHEEKNMRISTARYQTMQILKKLKVIGSCTHYCQHKINI